MTRSDRPDEALARIWALLAEPDRERDRTLEPILAAEARCEAAESSGPLCAYAEPFIEPVSRLTAGVAPVSQAGAPRGALTCAWASEAVYLLGRWPPE